VKNKGRKFLGLLVLAGVLVGAGWWFLDRSANTDNGGLEVAKVTRRDFAATVLATGAVKAQVGAEVKVGARISGRVERLYVNIGDEVTKGQVLAELERDELEAQVALCQAELHEAEARLAAIKAERPKEIAGAKATGEEAKAAMQLAELDWQRTKDLHEKHVATAHEMDTARKELDTASARLSLAEAELRLAEARFPDDVKIAEALVASKQASLASAEARLAYATIHAPIPGVVASVNTQEGETVAAGLNAPTFVTIIDLSRLQVDAFVDEVDIGRVKPGQRAVFTVDTFGDKEFQGKVTAIYPKAVIQDNVVNYDVVVDITTPYGGLLRPEMTANVTIFLEARQNVLALPAKAITRNRGRNIAYVCEGGDIETQEVKIGWRDGQWVEIVAGLKEGQSVLLNPLAKSQKETEAGP